MDQAEAHRQANDALAKLSEAAYVYLPGELDTLLADVIGELRRPLSTPAKVCMLGLMRLKQEAHAIRMLLGLGYPVQGMALAANMIEMAYDLLYVRDDQARADLWEAHSDFDKNWHGKKIRQRMQEGASSVLSTPAQVESMVDTDYQTYRILCAAKHGNPVLNKQTGGVVENGVLYLGPQNYSSEADRLNAAFAMNGVLRSSLIAAQSVVEYHVEGSMRINLESRIAQLNSERKMAIDPLLPAAARA